MTTHRDDTVKPGQGIDGDKGEKFTQEHFDRDCLISMYGMPLSPKGFRSPIECEYQEEVTPNSEVLAGARKGNRPLLGKGKPTSPEQTGWRRKLSGAF